jgi:phosphoribosylamine--glycine ligase
MGIDYVGFLYAGLMIGTDGTPYVLEFNCRLGDPETQPIMMRLASDLPSLCEAAVGGQLAECEAVWDPRPALGVVMAAGGYPGDYRKGDPIGGLDQDREGTKVFHAGTATSSRGTVTAGGRVLCVCAIAEDISRARTLAYDRVATIGWAGAFYRHDIGHRALTGR